ncbi:MAG TPA: alpha/beta fold hydrolase, partial [Solirubrobacteraceae bacterium]|nr:alpha/beta fold hydrolase [Solirubrobacteraceae bacterium]
MEFRLLGPLEARTGGAVVALGGRRQRALLARLLLDANRTVAVDRLVDDLWGEDVPDSAVKMVQIYVSRLRKALPGDVLRTRAPGYVIEVPPDALDLERFRRLAGEGRAALAAGDAATASERLRAALALWRGPALAEFGEPFARAEAGHLDELRLACLEERIDADLALGLGPGLVGELEALIARHPLRERLRAQHLVALYRAGRQAEALDAYQEHRRSLDEELGIEPSARLKELQRLILRQDPALDAPAAGDGAAAAGARGRSEAAPGDVRYARSGDLSIAYQVVGDGPLDLVLVHGWVCGFHAGWERPQLAGFYRGLGEMGRLILFDKRGTGLSDRVRGVATLEERMDDVRAVMDAAGSERAALLGISEGGPMAALFAATYPERTVALVAMGTFARRTPAPDYPIDIPTLRIVPEEWGLPVARRWVESRAPSIAHDEDAVRWYASYFARGASPAAAAALRRMNDEIDVRHVLPTIHVPTLVVHRTHEYLAEATAYMGERIPGAEVVALAGGDHVPWEGDQDAVLDAIRGFLEARGAEAAPDRVLTTVLCLRDGQDDGDAEARAALVRDRVARFRGREIAPAGGAPRAGFDGPARALRCAHALLAATGGSAGGLRAGVHTGECEVVGGALRGGAAA